MHKFAKRWRIGDFAWCEVYVSTVYYRHNSVENIALVVNATMLTSFLIMVKLSLYNFIRSHIQNSADTFARYSIDIILYI